MGVSGHDDGLGSGAILYHGYAEVMIHAGRMRQRTRLRKAWNGSSALEFGNRRRSRAFCTVSNSIGITCSLLVTSCQQTGESDDVGLAE